MAFLSSMAPTTQPATGAKNRPYAQPCNGAQQPSAQHNDLNVLVCHGDANSDATSDAISRAGSGRIHVELDFEH